jgi:hypothetical protein
MVNPDLAEASNLLWVRDHAPLEPLAGMVNVLVTGGSRWIAGYEGLNYKALLARPPSHRSAQHPRPARTVRPRSLEPRKAPAQILSVALGELAQGST